MDDVMKKKIRDFVEGEIERVVNDCECDGKDVDDELIRLSMFIGDDLCDEVDVSEEDDMEVWEFVTECFNEHCSNE